MKRVLEAADVYLCTSHDEGLGLPLLEAQFAGLPIVAPDKPVFREVLAGSGTFIDPGTAGRGCRCDHDSDRAAKLARPPSDCRNEQRSTLERRCRARSRGRTVGIFRRAQRAFRRPSFSREARLEVMSVRHPTRRQVLAGLTGALGIASTQGPKAFATETGTKRSLAAIAAEKGIKFGASFAVHELDGPRGNDYAQIYVRDARLLTSELGFKLATLRPTADKIDF